MRAIHVQLNAMKRLGKWARLICLVWMPMTSTGAVGVDPPIEEVTFEQRLNAQVSPDLSFRDSTGRNVTLQDYFRDRPILLSLVYYECPVLCQLSLQGLVTAMQEIPYLVGKDYTVITVSIDPHETHVMAAEKKAAYLEQYSRPGTEQGWHFLVGHQDQIQELCDTVGFGFKYDPETDEYAHRAGILLLTPNGVVSRYLPGIEYPRRDLRFGLVEASENKIGTIVDKIALLCYHYDPTAGAYSLLIMNVVRMGCFMTVLALAVLMSVLFKKEKKGMKRGKAMMLRPSTSA